MDSALKQRLVGAIVLVALAVIFLPMMLDGSGTSGPREIAIEIPAQPEPPANRLEATRDLSDTSLQERPAAEPAPAAASQPPASDDDTDIRAANDAAAAPASDAGDAAATDRGAETEAANGASDSTSNEVRATADEGSIGTGQAEEAGGPTAWVVQVGSFSRETNALVLRDRLREAEFDAFAERAGSGDSTLWRVRIGPVGTRDEADRLSRRVTEERGGDALVMTHP